MRGVNKTFTIGRLGADPELRQTPTNLSIATISVAVEEAWKDRNGDKQAKTQWFKIVLMGQHADFAAQYARKGSEVFVEGRLQIRKWQDKDGNDRWTTEIVAQNFQLLGGKPKIESKPEQYQPPQKSQPQQVREAYTGAGHYNEDECPF